VAPPPIPAAAFSASAPTFGRATTSACAGRARASGEEEQRCELRPSSIDSRESGAAVARQCGRATPQNPRANQKSRTRPR